MKMNRKILEVTLAASALAFAGNVAAQSTYPAAPDRTYTTTTYPATTTYYVATAPTQPYQLAQNDRGVVIVEASPIILVRDRWDIPYKDLVFLRELSRTDGSPWGDDLNPLVKGPPSRY